MEGKREKKEKKRGVETAGKNVRTERRIGGGWRGRRRIVRDSALVQSWSNYWHDLLGKVRTCWEREHGPIISADSGVGRSRDRPDLLHYMCALTVLFSEIEV